MSETDSRAGPCECGGTEEYEFHSVSGCADECFCEGAEEFTYHTPTGCADSSFGRALVTGSQPNSSEQSASEQTSGSGSGLDPVSPTDRD